MKYVLDTNIVARLLDGDPRVAGRLAAVETEDVGMPLVVLAELLFGVEKSVRKDANLARLEKFATGVRVLPFEPPVATRYSVVRAAVERKGLPKSDFDLVIACTALEHGATLRKRVARHDVQSRTNSETFPEFATTACFDFETARSVRRTFVHDGRSHRPGNRPTANIRIATLAPKHAASALNWGVNALRGYAVLPLVHGTVLAHCRASRGVHGPIERGPER